MLSAANGLVPTTAPPQQLHIAPMLRVSNREFRQLFRILSKRCILWTEMVVDETLAFTDTVEQHLGYDQETAPLICQIGGCTPAFAAKATRLVEEYGYTEINLNVDCPSDRVSGKQFGAVLMKHQETCVNMVRAMRESGQDKKIAISVKTRIGIDDLEDFDFMVDFIEALTPYCKRFYIHARKCLLNGLSPTENRIVPPLNYFTVYRLCHRFPECEFFINGGIAGLREAKRILNGIYQQEQVHAGAPCVHCKASNGSCVAPPSPRAPVNLRGAMLGRAAMDNPSLFWDVDRYFYGEASNPCRNRRQVLNQYCEYLERTYPRRCCDSDERMTLRIPAPTVLHERDCCEICQSASYGNENRSANLSLLPPRKAKISSHVIDRSLKPILNMFFGLPRAKVFRRVCDELSRDMRIRNCGPSFILQTAMRVISDDILDQDFVITEDLTEGDVVSHIAPRRKGGGCC
jgi:tRNA-dihydrouridine synthase A